MTATPLLKVTDLAIEFSTPQGRVRAVDGISFDVYENETLGIVGESGCGKTVTGLSLLGLIPSPPGRIAAGSIELAGRNLAKLDEAAMREVRGGEISMIFQEPMTALNPVFTVASQMTDVIIRHKGLTRAQARREAIDMLGKVGIPAPARRLDDYPHQMSGGMRQRVMIAMALACGPKLLVADEPTTALDVTTQAQVIELIGQLQREFRMAVILITHDLGVVAETCQRALVMYCGRIAEQAQIEPLFRSPRHPYTHGLLDSIPRIRDQRLTQLPTIAGRVPDLLNLPPGCRFADRCTRAQEDCRTAEPELTQAGQSAFACYHPIGHQPAEPVA